MKHNKIPFLPFSNYWMMDKKADSNRFVIIDNMYTFGMLLVLLGHIGLTPSFNDSYLHRWIYAFHMPLFFWIAGFLFDTRPRGIKFLARKAKRLLIPLFVLTTIVFLPKVFLSQFALRPIEGGWLSYLESLFIPSDNPVQPLWFLTVLFCVYVIGELTTCISVKYNRGGWFVCGLISAFVSYLCPRIEFLGISGVLYYFPYFCLGVICRKLKVTDYSGLFSITNSIILFCLLCVVVYYPVNKYLSAVVGLSFSISFIGWLDKKNIPFFPHLRDYTFCIYLLQWFPMVFVRIVFFNLLHINIWVCYCLMFLTGLFVPILFAKLILKCCHKGNLLYRSIAYSCGLA